MRSLAKKIWLRVVARNRPHFSCPICEYHGPFQHKVISAKPRKIREHSKCPNCGSNERHRILYLLLHSELIKRWRHRLDENSPFVHVAPEQCLVPQIKSLFSKYVSIDLLREDVDLQEDLQQLTFPDASVQCILVSRVLTMPPNLTACLSEISRVLRHGGIAIIAEFYRHEETVNFNPSRNERYRELGTDFLCELNRHFDHVELVFSDQFPARFQLINHFRSDQNNPHYTPSLIHKRQSTHQEVVALCRKES